MRMRRTLGVESGHDVRKGSHSCRSPQSRSCLRWARPAKARDMGIHGVGGGQFGGAADAPWLRRGARYLRPTIGRVQRLGRTHRIEVTREEEMILPAAARRNTTYSWR